MNRFLDNLENYLINKGESLFDLQKALTATEGAMYDMETMEGGRTLQLENVQDYLTEVMIQNMDFTFGRNIPIENMGRIVDRFTRQTSYGALGGRNPLGTFSTETGMPESTDVELLHDIGQAKFQRTVNSISHVVDSSRNEIDPHKVMNNAASRMILDSQDRELIYGDSALVSQEYDGLIKQIQAIHDDGVGGTKFNRVKPVIHDLRNANMQEADLLQSLENIRLNYGAGDKMFLPFELKTDIDTRFLSNTIRINQPGTTPMGGHTAGVPIERFHNINARGNFMHFYTNRFLPSGNNGACVTPTGAVDATGDTALVAPTSFTAVATGVAHASSKWVAADNGDYQYKAVSRTRNGNSVTTTVDAAGTAVAGEGILITIEAPAGATAGTYVYDLYRSKKDAVTAVDCRFIGSVLNVGPDAGTNTTFTDYNEYIPGTAIAFILDCGAPIEERALSFRRLLPFTRIQMPFAYNNLFASSWAYLLYGYLRVLKPSMIMIKNIKVDSTTF